MITLDFPHRGRAQTARFMYGLASAFKDDLGSLAVMPFEDFYNFVREIPYINDMDAWGDPNRELLARPGQLLQWKRKPGLDCKKKAILMGAWAENNRVPWELIGMSEAPTKEIHHVFPLLYDGKAWVNMDATYPSYRIGEPKPKMTSAERFSR